MEQQRPERQRAAILVAGGLLGLVLVLVGVSTLMSQRNTIANYAAETRTASAEWPTLGPTFTPLPTQTPIPTATNLPTATPLPAPTPIVIDRKQVGELSTLALTVSSTQIIRSQDAQLFGISVPGTGESITVEYIAHVKLGLNADAIRYTPNGATVMVILPQLEILSIEPDWNQSRVVNTNQRLIGSNTTELQKQAWSTAHDAIRQRMLSDAELLAQARQYARLRIKDQLEQLGFTKIEIR